MIRRVLSILSIALLLSCGEPAETFDYAGMLQSIGDTVILPTYDDFAQATSELDIAAHAFCTMLDEPTYVAMEAAYRAAKTRLKLAEAFAIGPHTDSPLRLGPTVDFWPPRPADVDAVLAGSDALDPDALDSVGAGARGFPAMDYLIHPSTEPSEALAAFVAEPRRCEYLQAMTGNAARQARAYVGAWEGPEGHLALLVSGSDPYRDTFGAASAMFDQVLFTVENVRELKIGKPFGKRSSGVPQPAELEAPYGERSLQDAIDALQSTRNIWAGNYEGVEGVGLRDWLRARRPALEPDVEAAFDLAFATLRAIPEPYSSAITDAPTEVETAYVAIKDLQVLLAVDIAGALGVTVSFNPTDGD